MAGNSEQSRTYTFGGRGDAAVKKWPIAMKSVQVVLCILCLILIDDPVQNFRIKLILSQRIISLCYGTFVTYLICSGVYLIGKVIGDEWPWKTTTILSGIAAILFIVCGGLLLRDYANIRRHNVWPLFEAEERMNGASMTIALLLGTGILSVITGVSFLIESILMVWIGRK